MDNRIDAIYGRQSIDKKDSRRGFRDAASRCQSDRHIQPSTILIQHESSAMRPSVLRMIASGS